MAYGQFTALWTGFPGAPGYSKFRVAAPVDASSAPTIAGVIAQLFTGIRANLPPSVTIQVQSPAELYDDVGELTGFVDYTPVAPVVGGAAASAYLAPAGAVIDWGTATVANGRRVRGRTFLVPLSTFSDSDGSIIASVLTTLPVSYTHLTLPTKA